MSSFSARFTRFHGSVLSSAAGCSRSSSDDTCCSLSSDDTRGKAEHSRSSFFPTGLKVEPCWSMERNLGRERDRGDGCPWRGILGEDEVTWLRQTTKLVVLSSPTEWVVFE